VTTTADSGAGSLRQAVLDANANAGADEIVFDPSIDREPELQTISLRVSVRATWRERRDLASSYSGECERTRNEQVRGSNPLPGTAVILQGLPAGAVGRCRGRRGHLHDERATDATYQALLGMGERVVLDAPSTTRAGEPRRRSSPTRRWPT
jgi:hypothetical protein